MILTLIIHWIVAALVLLLVGWLIPGIEISGFGVALVAALVIGIINLLIRPIVMLLTLPINILTLGLFALVINALLFALAAWMVPGFEIFSFWSALLGSLLLAILSALINSAGGRPGAV
jgi:putative membrane protein